MKPFVKVYEFVMFALKPQNKTVAEVISSKYKSITNLKFLENTKVKHIK